MILCIVKKKVFSFICIGPRAKQDVFDKYNLDKAALNEPNYNQKKILATLNKTIEEFFMEATFKLNEDFRLFMIWWDYGTEGWKRIQKQISLGDDNTQKVFKIKYPIFYKIIS